MPFNIRNMEDEKKARMGVVECVHHRLIEPFQVLFDKEGEIKTIFYWESPLEIFNLFWQQNLKLFLCLMIQSTFNL